MSGWGDSNGGGPPRWLVVATLVAIVVAAFAYAVVR